VNSAEVRKPSTEVASAAGGVVAAIYREVIAEPTHRGPAIYNPNLREKIAMAEEKEDKTIYKVLVNHEEQYSLWPAHKANALGWKDGGKIGTKEECLAYIKEVWVDMRPLSVRKKMQEQGVGVSTHND
jgi:MbtH protein